MKARRLVLAMVGSLVLSGAALAQDGMGKGMGMGMMGGGDEKVTKEQFLKHAEERFGRMDANKDGVLDATDRKAMRERMRECREMMGGMGMMGGGMMGGMGGMGDVGDKAGKPAAEHHPAP